MIEGCVALPEAPVTPAVMDRALHVAGLLAAAEAAGLVVLHYDDDYDRIPEPLKDGPRSRCQRAPCVIRSGAPLPPAVYPGEPW